MSTLTSGDRRTLQGQIATRERSWEGWGLANWLPNPDPILKALGRDISVYRDLRADAHIGGCIRRRKAAVHTLEPVLERAGSPAQVHRAVIDILADLWATPDPTEAGAQPGLPALIAESLDGALYGYQPHEITWGRVGALLVPTVVQGKPPEWFLFDGANQLRFRSRDGGVEGERLPARKFLLSRQDPTYQNPYGIADLSLCFWPGTFKRAGLKFWAKFVEKYGGAFIVGKLPRANPTKDYDDLTERLAAMVEDAVAAIPDDGAVEILTSSGTAASTDAHLRFVLYNQGQIAMALLGTNQGTEQTSTVASAVAALEVADDIRDGDARMTEAVVNQLIRWVVEINWPGAAAPRWELRAAERVDKTRAERDKLLTEAGVTFSPAYWQRSYNLSPEDLAAAPEPEEPEEPVALAAPAPDPTPSSGQALIDAEVARDAGAAQQAAMERLLAPILTALAQGLTPEEILGRMDDWYGQLDDTLLQELLTRGMAAADAIGRLEVAAETAHD